MSYGLERLALREILPQSRFTAFICLLQNETATAWEERKCERVELVAHYTKKSCSLQESTVLRVLAELAITILHPSCWLSLLIPFICWILMGQRIPRYMGSVRGIGAPNIRHSCNVLFTSRA